MMTRLMIKNATVAILKPHICKQPKILKEVEDIIEKNNFKIFKKTSILFHLDLAEQFYSEHANKFFYNRLITSMLSGPCLVYILSMDGNNDAIKKWRDLMGPTKCSQAQYFEFKDTMRSKYGLSDTRNAFHGSDSIDSANREFSILFSNGD